ncbi:MAG: GntR family transcriptional regulator [Eubacterium sp.]|nr:GntR family transcriptional regulator [Eubacterium sp.]
MIQVDLRSSQPIYEQIISQYKYMYLQGYLKKGDPIPSVRKLALQLDVTPGTVAKAYGELERMGMIETVRGRGTFIAQEAEIKRDEGMIVKMKENMRETCMELIYQGMNKEEIMKIVQELLDQLTQEEGGEK